MLYFFFPDHITRIEGQTIKAQETEQERLQAKRVAKEKQYKSRSPLVALFFYDVFGDELFQLLSHTKKIT